MGADRESVSVRAAGLADVDGVLEVQRRSPGRSGTAAFREQVARAVVDPSLLFLVATSQSETVGWAMTKHFPEPAAEAPAGHYLMGVTVTPPFRHQGVATMLVRARLDWIRQRDSSAYYFTNLRNAASIALHGRFGFREVARGAEFRGVSFDGGIGVLFARDVN